MQPAIKSRVLSFILITAPEASLHISPILPSLGGFVCWAYGTNYKFTDTIARVGSGQNSLAWKPLVEKRREFNACLMRDRCAEYLEGTV